MEQKETFQAVLIADNFTEAFSPYDTVSLIPCVNVPLLDYALESLNRSGVEEVFLFVSSNIDQIKTFVADGKKQHKTWSINMSVEIVSSEGCRCFGDALRDLDAKGLIRGHFVLMGAGTVTNAKLEPIFEEHKNICKTDKGAAMTVIYKQIPGNQRTGDEVLIATDARTNRLLFHQKLKSQQKERRFQFPLEIFLENSEIVVHHDLIDPQIAICAPSVLPLFADNFDFETRDDFIRGLLINEEILASTIYVKELPEQEYARKVTNWQSYNLVSNDIINRWVYPLVPNNGICQLKQQYAFLRNMVYKNEGSHLERDARLKANVVIQGGSSVGNESVLNFSVVGKSCKIGSKCTLNNAFVFDGVQMKDNVHLEYCIIGKNVKIGEGCRLDQGTVVGDNCILPSNTKLSKAIVRCTKPDDFDADDYEKLADKAYVLKSDESIQVESDEEDDPKIVDSFVRMSQLESKYAESMYSSSSEDDEHDAPSPVQEDSNIFLSEVIESLKRGFDEKSNPDFLILEINSSRYAYNMTLSEVNFYVIKAILSMPLLQTDAAKVFSAFEQLMKYFGPVVKNYIKGDAAMNDCLKAFEETFTQTPALKARGHQLLHYLYDNEILSEDAIVSWYENIDEDSGCKTDSIAKFIQWLEDASEEEDSEDD